MFQSLRMLSRKRSSAPGRSGNSKRYKSSFLAKGARPPTMCRRCVFAISLSERSNVRNPWRRRLRTMRARTPRAHFDAHENVRVVRIGDAVVELRDVAPAERGAELAEASRALWNGDRQDRFAVLA